MWILTITFSPPVGERSFKLGKKNDDEKGSNPFSPPVGERSFKWKLKWQKKTQLKVFAPCRGKVFQINFYDDYFRFADDEFSPPVGERSFKLWRKKKQLKIMLQVFAPCRGKVFQIPMRITFSSMTLAVFAPCRGKVFQMEEKKNEKRNDKKFSPPVGERSFK